MERKPLPKKVVLEETADEAGGASDVQAEAQLADGAAPVPAGA